MTQILQTSPPVFPNSKRPTAIIDEADSEAMAILNYNKPSAYLVPTLLYEKMIEIIEDYYLAQAVEERLNDGEKPIKVSLDEL